MLVWQDMVCGGSSYRHWFVTYLATLFNAMHITIKDGRHSRFLLSRRDAEGRKQFLRETKETIEALRVHPSIVCWVPFNEGWGQFDALKIADFVRQPGFHKADRPCQRAGLTRRAATCAACTIISLP